MSEAPLIYFAAPLFSAAERAFNLALTERIESLGFRVFLPQRNGPDRDKPGYREMPPERRSEMIFAADRDKVLESDILLFVLDGRVPDEGACVELGIAYAQRYLQTPEKRLIGLHTDVRGAFLTTRLNPMVGVALDAIAESEDELLTLLSDLLRPTRASPHRSA